MSARARVRVPATTANLGPGFDCLGLALDLWNQADFRTTRGGVRVSVRGEGAGRLPEDETNLIARAALRFYAARGLPPPPGLAIECDNQIPLGAGLGSSAAAILLGLLGADALLGSPAGRDEILALASEMEGHPDNSAAALYGGLVLCARIDARIFTRVYPLEGEPITAAVAIPEVDLPTQAARRALPEAVPLADAAFNAARTPLVVEALRSGDLALLGSAMHDRLHQPYRLPLIPGAEGAFLAAREAGAAAVALSGAGPGVIAFTCGDAAAVAAAMAGAFNAAGVPARRLVLQASQTGAWVG